MSKLDFTFVTDDRLRDSLESDYRELCDCMKVKAWKSAHVLAGSIVEALLIDWLDANGITRHKGTDLLKIDLTGAVEACKENGLITARAESLTAVVRGYRNLIHPGRLLRTQETVDERGAVVARSLVEMIALDIARSKSEKYGHTAEQVVAKLVSDPSSASYIGHLVKTISNKEKERLLLKVIEKRHHDFASGAVRCDDGTGEILDGLSKLFRLTFELVSDEIRARALCRYVCILKSAGDFVRETYEEAFFVAHDLRHCAPGDVDMVVAHLLARLKGESRCFSMYRGVGKWLDGEKAVTFIDALLEQFSAKGTGEWESEASKLMRGEVHEHGTAPVRAAALRRLEQRKATASSYSESLAEKIDHVIRNEDYIPF